MISQAFATKNFSIPLRQLLTKKIVSFLPRSLRSSRPRQRRQHATFQNCNLQTRRLEMQDGHLSGEGQVSPRWVREWIWLVLTNSVNNSAI